MLYTVFLAAAFLDAARAHHFGIGKRDSADIAGSARKAMGAVASSSMQEPPAPSPPKTWENIMQELRFNSTQESSAQEIFTYIGNAKTGIEIVSGEEADLRKECMLYVERIYPHVTWQAVCYWMLEERFNGQDTLGEVLQEGVELVMSGRATAELAATAILHCANS